MPTWSYAVDEWRCVICTGVQALHVCILILQLRQKVVAGSDADPDLYYTRRIRICMERFESGSRTYDIVYGTYTVNGQKHGKNLKIILKFGFFATFLKFSLNIYNFFSFVPIY